MCLPARELSEASEVSSSSCSDPLGHVAAGPRDGKKCHIKESCKKFLAVCYYLLLVFCYCWQMSGLGKWHLQLWPALASRPQEDTVHSSSQDIPYFSHRYSTSSEPWGSRWQGRMQATPWCLPGGIAEECHLMFHVADLVHGSQWVLFIFIPWPRSEGFVIYSFFKICYCWYQWLVIEFLGEENTK